MIQTESLTFQYAKETSFAFPDISLDKGEHLLMLGKSGVGKTTLLHLLAGILSPKSGKVVVEAQELSALSKIKLDRFRGQHVGLIYQKPHFVQSLTLKENMFLVQYLAGKKQDLIRVKEVLTQLDMQDQLNKSPNKLSQGQQQRASIAMAMLNKPAVILADEPTSSLDDENCTNVIQLLKDQSEEVGASLIVITHDARLKDQFQNSIAL
ncbi:MAG: ATP-binding cassette domain-containing protein [Cytophagales bacterium]|nr:ATP-binding cassette domain-containing protein [Cytophagales bacterium]